MYSMLYTVNLGLRDCRVFADPVTNDGLSLCRSYGHVYFEAEITRVYKMASCFTQCSLQLPCCLLA